MPKGNKKVLRLDFEAFTCHLRNIYEPVNDTFGIFAKGGIWEKHCYEEAELKGTFTDSLVPLLHPQTSVKGTHSGLAKPFQDVLK